LSDKKDKVEEIVENSDVISVITRFGSFGKLTIIVALGVTKSGTEGNTFPGGASGGGTCGGGPSGVGCGWGSGSGVGGGSDKGTSWFINTIHRSLLDATKNRN
jgi:hypothetical protein